VTPQLAEQFELPREFRGVVVTEVDPNGPSCGSLRSPEEGGPDIIQAVEGAAVRTEQDLRTALKAAGKGEIVTLRVYNVGAKQSRVERVRLE
jgi:S1-C subfamily serine protease